jgi:amidohydrolase
MSIKQRIRELTDQYHQDTIELRRKIHANPELAFEEVETSKLVVETLKSYGVKPTENVAKTGVVALIEGRDPGTRTIALRADMDALPIQEENAVPYRSQNAGKMHACGHDVHTSSLLGADRILQEMREEWSGTVKLIFQPSEEKLPGGAKVMIQEGALENPAPQRIWGQHVHPPLEVGKIGMKAGPYMASADEIYMTIKGKGGHAAIPQGNVDPIIISAHILTALQQIVSRKSDPTMPSVLSFGKIIGNGATNVIPDEVYVEGTFRTFDEDWRQEAHQLIKNMTLQIAASMGATCEMDLQVGYPYVHNDEALTKATKELAIDYLDKENVVELPMRMTGEDFAFYSQVLPGCFYRLGTGNPQKGIVSPIHTSTFDIDEDALKVGVGMLAWLGAVG